MADAARKLPKLVGAESVAESLGVTRKHVYLLVHRGQIPGECIVHIGRRLRFHADLITSWVAENTSTSRTGAK
jgi:excisionase family DNA binding protein